MENRDLGPKLARLGSLPPEVLFGAAQHARVTNLLEGLSVHDYDAFTKLAAQVQG